MSGPSGPLFLLHQRQMGRQADPGPPLLNSGDRENREQKSRQPNGYLHLNSPSARGAREFIFKRIMIAQICPEEGNAGQGHAKRHSDLG